MAFNLFTTVDQAMQSAISNAVASMSGGWASSMINIIGASIALSVTCMAFLVIAGKIQEPINEVIWKLGSILIILAFINNANGWLSMVNSVVNELKDTFAGSGSSMATLDKFITDMVAVSDRLYDEAGKLERIYIMPAFWFGVVMVVISAFPVMLLNGITLTILLATSPIFIGCLSYPAFRGMFNNWLQLIFANIFTIMFMAIIFKGIEGIGKMMISADITNRMLAAVSMILLGVTAAKFASLAVELGRALASVSVESAQAAVGAQRVANKASGKTAMAAGSAAASGAGKAAGWVRGRFGK